MPENILIVQCNLCGTIIAQVNTYDGRCIDEQDVDGHNVEYTYEYCKSCYHAVGALNDDLLAKAIKAGEQGLDCQGAHG